MEIHYVHCSNTIHQKTLKRKAFMDKIAFFVNCADFYVNAIMLTKIE